MQAPSYLGKIALVSIWCYDGINPNNDLGMHRCSHLVIPTKYQYMNGITILVSFG